MELETIKVLLIEHVAKFARLLQDTLQDAKGVRFGVDWAQSLQDGLVRLRQHRPDVVLLDLSLSENKGLDSFEQARGVAAHVPIIVLSSLDDENLALRAVQEGAQDYLVKQQINDGLLVRSIRYAIERKRVELALLRTEEKYRSIFEHIVEGIFQTTPDGN